MKVLFVLENLSGGGAERVLVNLANNMAQRGHDVSVRLLAGEGVNIDKLSDKVKYSFVFRKSFKGMNYLHLLPHRMIYSKIVNDKYDVVIPYLHGVLTKIVSYAMENQKTAAFLHANMENSPFMHELKKSGTVNKVFDTYDRIISVSRDVQESFIRATGINDDRLCVLYNTFDVDGIRAKAKEEYRDKFGDGCIRLCSVGKLQQVKGYLRLVEAVGKLRRDGINCVLTIVGEGEQRAETERLISESGLNDHITLAGFDTNPYKYIANSDLFVCSSYSEGFSSVVAESLILGVPVLTTDCAGMREMLGENGEYGVIVDNSDEALYVGLRDMLTSEGKLAYYREMAMSRSAFFEPEQTVGAVEKMLEEVIGQ